MRVFLLLLILVLTLPSGGCALFMNDTRALTQAETDLLGDLHHRVRGNRGNIEAAVGDLVAISASALEDEDSLSRNVAKAKLLESMQSPWTRPSDSMVETQRAVALYHLYDLADAERVASTARLAERREAAQSVLEAFDQLSALTNKAIESQKLVLAHLNRDKGALLAAFVSTVAGEVQDFHEALAKSDDPKLRKLAADVARAEERVEKSKAGIEQALGFLLGER